ncbi:MAG TPA: hypothetical protein VN379_19965 [Sporomusa sp.]|nr:hypothetical protein [Sporomusa sp.]
MNGDQCLLVVNANFSHISFHRKDIARIGNWYRVLVSVKGNEAVVVDLSLSA